jgi:hypothetical protein
VDGLSRPLFLLNFFARCASQYIIERKKGECMSDYLTNAGEIKVKETKWGLGFYCFNVQRQRMVHIGSLRGQCYEKITAILYSPEPSISLTRAEFSAAMDSGAVFLRFIPSDKSRTYSISVVDFQQHAVPYYQANYGKQWRVPLSAFQSIAAVRPRNAITDSPRLSQSEPIGPRQLSLFSADSPEARRQRREKTLRELGYGEDIR